MEGIKLKEMLQRTGLTMTEISNKMGITAQMLNTYFQNKDVKSGVIENICEKLGLDICYFYKGKTIKDNKALPLYPEFPEEEGGADICAEAIPSNNYSKEDIDFKSLINKKDEQLDKILEQNKKLIIIIENLTDNEKGR